MNSDPIFEGLNPPQRHAVETVEGRVLILAGAGSGKTRVLTLRMAHLIKNLKISPKAILGLTFTNKAAAEMRHRMAALVDPKLAKQVTLSTFHSFCMQLLRNEAAKLGYTQQFSLYDEKDVQRLIASIARDLLEHEGEMPSLASTVAAISQAKNRGLRPEEISGTGSEWHDQFTRTLFQRLHDSMRAYNAMDFDNLICQTVELFDRCPEVLERYQEQYRYLMIDEYQDTNPIQSKLAAQLSAKYQNLCVVGDDDQSIYGWRGAEVKNILKFEQATVVTLEQNYRSTNHILKAANGVIKNNRERHPKALWSSRGEGEPIEVFFAPNEKEEAEAVVRRLVKLREEHHLKWSDFAILYRSNALSRQFELALASYTWKEGEQWIRGIPYQVFGGLEFYERREVKDILAYLRVVSNPLDQEALLRSINQPRRGIGEAALDALTSFNRDRNIPLWDVLLATVSSSAKIGGLDEIRSELCKKAAEGIRSFVQVIEEAKQRFQQNTFKEGLEWLIERIQYQKAIAEEVKSEQMRSFKWENVQEIITAIGEYEQETLDNPEKSASLQDFLSSVPLGNADDNFHRKKGRLSNAVNLMTFHSAKGLEFPVCFLVGMEDHIMPHEKSLKETGIEEERRLMYVALTRAMRHLTISMAQQRMRMGKLCASRPSRFLMEIPQELLKPTLWGAV